MKLTDQQVEALVNWWTDRLRAPKFDNGGTDPANMMAQMLASMNAAHTRPSDDGLEEFGSALRERLSGDDAPHYLTVDYGPDSNLRAAASAGSIDASRFPWKTTAWVNENGSVKATCGYGAPRETILEASATPNPTPLSPVPNPVVEER